MRLKHQLEYALLRSLISFINLLPVPVILALCTGVGTLAWVIFPFRIRVAYKNLATVFPKLDHDARLRLLRRVYPEFARTFGLIFILHRKKFRRLIASARINGRDKLDQALAGGKGAILTTIHAIWFEAYFAWFNQSGLPSSLIYQRQKNPLSDHFFVRLRQHHGQSLAHLNSREGMAAFHQALLDNRLLIVSLDQSYTSRGIKVPFFNRPMACARGTAMLHLRSGSPVLTSVYYMKNGNLHLDFDLVDLPEYSEINEESIADISTRCLRQYEPFIRRYPEQWFSLFHRLWGKKEYPKVERNLRQIFL